MKKIKSIPVYLMLVVLCSIFVVSCSEDNSVTPPPVEPYHYDSARFNWKVDTLFGQGFYAGLWAKDTNDIFITNVFTNRLYRIQNSVKSYIQYPVNTYLGLVTGDEMNNGYVVATKLVGSIYQPFLQKFEGNIFVEISNPQNLERNFFFNAVMIKNPNEMWFGADGFIVKFDGTNLTSYPLEDSTTKILKFFYDENSKFKILCSLYHPELFGGRTEFLIYEFTENKWERIYGDLENPRPLRYYIINKDVAAVNGNIIFKLTDNVLIPTLNVVPKFFQFPCNGQSFNDIIIAANDQLSDCYASLFHWNGNRWSFELCGYWVDPSTEIYLIKEYLYYCISYDQNGRTYLMRGLKK